MVIILVSLQLLIILKNKMYRLKKVLYSLKQTHKLWYSHIAAYLETHEFENYTYEHILFVKYGETGMILIVWLYVDDVIYIDNDVNMINEFQSSV